MQTASCWRSGHQMSKQLSMINKVVFKQMNEAEFWLRLDDCWNKRSVKQDRKVLGKSATTRIQVHRSHIVVSVLFYCRRCGQVLLLLPSLSHGRCPMDLVCKISKQEKALGRWPWLVRGTQTDQRKPDPIRNQRAVQAWFNVYCTKVRCTYTSRQTRGWQSSNVVPLDNAYWSALLIAHRTALIVYYSELRAKSINKYQ